MWNVVGAGFVGHMQIPPVGMAVVTGEAVVRMHRDDATCHFLRRHYPDQV